MSGHRNVVLASVIVATLALLGSAAGGNGVAADDHALGNPKAKVVVVEFAAPMCPFCAKFNAEGFPLLKAQYIDTGKVRYVFRMFPIGAPDLPAESMARCLPKNRYFTFLDQLYRNQASWDPEFGVTDVKGGLLAQGRIAGLSSDRALACMMNNAVHRQIMAEAQDDITRHGIHATPTFMVDGEVLEPGLPWSGLKAKLDAALAKNR